MTHRAERHDKLQREYEFLKRELQEKEIEIDNLQRAQLAVDSNNTLHYVQTSDFDSNGHQRQPTKQNQTVLISESEHLEKMEFLKNSYEDNLLSIELDYKSQIEAHQKQIKALNKELNEGDKENDALRQSLEAMEHENESLRISINANNKTFQSLKLYQSKNKQLLSENEALKQQIDALEIEMDAILQQNEEREHQNELMQQQMQMQQANHIEHTAAAAYLNHPAMTAKPQTPTHRISKTIVMGGGSVEALSNKGSSNQNVSDHGSSTTGGGNDLLHQIGDYHDMSPPNDRDSNYGSNEESEDDEKRIMNEYDDDDDDEDNDNENEANVLSQLARYKEIDDMGPNSMQQIMALLQQKEDKRNNLSASQQNVDAFSLESNYSDSEQKMEEQLDSIEDDVRELKDMLLSLMDATNNITPQINQNLGPLLRKINRMYVMLSGPIGPMQSRMSHLNKHRSVNGISLQQSVNSYQSERSSQIDLLSQKQKATNEVNANWMSILTPYINDWIPSIGFSAIILSTMYLIVKYHNGRFIGIGSPRVLRNNRK